MNTHTKSLLSRERIKQAIEAFAKAEAEHAQPDPVEGKPVEPSRAPERERLTNSLTK